MGKNLKVFKNILFYCYFRSYKHYHLKMWGPQLFTVIILEHPARQGSSSSCPVDED